MKELIDLINQFRDERDWRKFHNEKDLEEISKQVDKWIMEIIYKYGLNHFEENVEKYAEDIYKIISDAVAG